MVQFHGFESFVRMGGYGHYIWLAFSIVFILMFCNAYVLRFQLRRLVRKLRRRDESSS